MSKPDCDMCGGLGAIDLPLEPPHGIVRIECSCVNEHGDGEQLCRELYEEYGGEG